MGNASVFRRNETGSSGAKSDEETEEGEEYMEFPHVSYHTPAPFQESMVQSPPHSPRAYHSPLVFTPQVSVTPLQRPGGIIPCQTDESKQNKTLYEAMFSEHRIPTVITWNHEGEHVSIEGSWDNWKTREFLQRSGRDLTIMKVLPSGVYHYRFIVDGQWRCAPELPQECDDMGNIFNILDLKENIPEIHNIPESEAPNSPFSSYDNAPFSLEDLSEKLPELPPLLQRTPLDQPSSSTDSPQSLEKPLTGILNHLYIQKAGSAGESMAALSSTQRFRKKYVTVVLYKSLEKLKP